MRAFVDADFDRVVASWHETNRLSYPYVLLHQQHTLDDARAFFREKLLQECRVWIAERGTDPLGLLAMCDSWIRQLAVFPAFQRQGVGTALLCRAREQSPQEMRLYTFRRNYPARSFYEKHGFVPIAFGTSPAPESEPDVEYLWRV
ncbi:MAG TPA: GNAT family N-acetyltransferase [Casimicrobiaceae bacterium]|nr:GNAT family N-acetyltransferase [Casimicrobiaceae bacterium]